MDDYQTLGEQAQQIVANEKVDYAKIDLDNFDPNKLLEEDDDLS